MGKTPFSALRQQDKGKNQYEALNFASAINHYD